MNNAVKILVLPLPAEFKSKLSYSLTGQKVAMVAMETGGYVNMKVPRVKMMTPEIIR